MATQSLLKAVIGVLTTIIFGYLIAQHFSRDSSFTAPMNHPLAIGREAGKYPPRVISYMGSAEYAPGSLAGVWEAAKLSREVWIWLDLRPTQDDSWVVISDPQLESVSDTSGLIGLMSWAEVSKARLRSPTGAADSATTPNFLLRLEDIVTAFPNHTFVLNFKEYRPGDDHKIHAVLEKLNADNRIIVQSDIQGLLKDLRKQKASRVYGLGFAEVGKLRYLLKLNLGGLLDITGDTIFLVPTSAHRLIRSQPGPAPAASLTVLTTDLKLNQELHRRGRPVFIGPSPDLDLELKWVSDGYDGVITHDAKRLCTALTRHQFASCNNAG